MNKHTISHTKHNSPLKNCAILHSFAIAIRICVYFNVLYFSLYAPLPVCVCVSLSIICAFHVSCVAVARDDSLSSGNLHVSERNSCCTRCSLCACQNLLSPICMATLLIKPSINTHSVPPGIQPLKRKNHNNLQNSYVLLSVQ